MNNLTTFNSDVFGTLRTITINEESYFVAKDVAEALGYSKPQNAIATHVDEDDTLKQGIIDKLGREQQTTLINESGMYSLIFGSKLDTAKQFKRWVTSEVLPEIRKAGCYISEDATDEAIDFNRLYGKYKLRKTFSNTKDLRAEYERYAELSKIERDCKRITNKDRIYSCKVILDIIETKIAENITTLRGSEVLALQELALDIQTDLTKLHNRMNSGIKSAQTKRIQQLEDELALTQNNNDDYYFIDSHGFSANYMYSYGKDKVVKSAAYHRWENNLNLNEYLPATYPNINFTKPIRVTVLFGQKKELDTNNLGKSIIDQIAEYYSFNDSLVHETVLSLHDYVESFEDGYMYLKIENI